MPARQDIGVPTEAQQDLWNNGKIKYFALDLLIVGLLHLKNCVFEDEVVVVIGCGELQSEDGVMHHVDQEKP